MVSWLNSQSPFPEVAVSVSLSVMSNEKILMYYLMAKNNMLVTCSIENDYDS